MISEKRQTMGEKLVQQLLAKLPQNEFFYVTEPKIVTKDGRESKPDFIIVVRRRGVVILEVKDWVRLLGGNQQDIQIERRDGVRESKKNPMKTVEDYAYDLASRFEERKELCQVYQNRTSLKFPWQGVVILPNISQKVINKFENERIWKRGTVFGEEIFSDLEVFKKALLDIPWTWKLQTPLDPKTLDVIRGVLDPHLIVTDMEGNDIGTLDLRQETLVKESLPSAMPQNVALFDSEDLLSEEARTAVADHHLRLVRGVAGSGKTLVLIHRAKYLTEVYPNSNILLLTFNKDLATNLQKRLPNVEVVNFHKLCRDIIGNGWHSPNYTQGWLERYAKSDLINIGLTSEFIADEFEWRKDLEVFDLNEYLSIERKGRGTALNQQKRSVINKIFQSYRIYQDQQRVNKKDWMDWADVPLHALDILKNSIHLLKNHYDTILIDEAQDFAPTWVKVIKELLKPNGSLFICDDPTQSLFKYFSWRQKGLEVVGRTRVLKIPYRCTKQINIAAYGLIEADPILCKDEEIMRPDLDSSQLVEGEIPNLFQFSNLDGELQFIKNEVQELLKSNLAANQIAILCHSKGIVKYWASMREIGIYVEHFEKMKGLEFQAVFIPHLHTAFMNLTDPVDVSNERRRIFTAMTRARYRLYMSHHGNLPSQLEPINEHVWRENI
ncbi:MAG: UvrD-helicase domain-containing protein [Anaerolineae bacterium]|nr:UvrD-helicase domain-containing protein [Anaerolineae bacterium]